MTPKRTEKRRCAPSHTLASAKSPAQSCQAISYGRAIAIFLFGYNYFAPIFSLRDMIGHKNLIRNVDNRPCPTTQAMEVYHNERILITDNIIDLDNPLPLHHSQCGSAQTFRNLQPNGTVIVSFNFDLPPVAALEISAKIQADLDDAVLVGFLGS